eukprot:TRINITY_DN93595_c0_g1_i1.p1 TRINITY_DN93595_c0_g1~~TRINITY_DN93595_c0_g1_i1.p1  ORF type:complete len:897 (-),score=161.25 TRINITY_DN93595_c0_g1_i1:118-2769(-)
MPKTDAQREAARRARQRRAGRQADEVAAILEGGGPVTGNTIAMALKQRHRVASSGSQASSGPALASPQQVARQEAQRVAARCLGSLVEFLRRQQVVQATHLARVELQRESITVKDLMTLLSAIRPRSKPEEVLDFLGVVMASFQGAGEAAGQYVLRFGKWLVQEHMAECQASMQRAMSVSPEVLMQAGFCVPSMILQPITAGAGNEVELVGELPASHYFQRGDVLLVTPLRSSPGHDSVDAEIQSILPDSRGFVVKLLGNFQFFDRCRVDKVGNRVTFSRALESLKLLATVGSDGPFGPMKELLTHEFAARAAMVEQAARALRAPAQATAAPIPVGPLVPGRVAPAAPSYPPSLPAASAQLDAFTPWEASLGPAKEVQLCNELVARMDKSAKNSPIWATTNPSQKVALMSGLQRRLTLVQGPPGSGKTHTSVQLVRLWLEAGRCPILCTADSNVAVDNLLAGCAEAGLKVARIGRPEGVRQDLERYTLNDQACKRLEERGRLEESKGAPDPQALWGVEMNILKSVQVVCATCSGVANSLLDSTSFPCVLVDEAGQAIEPMTLLPIVRPGIEQAVLVGDHQQLPPTVVCREAEKEGLGMPLFERLVKRGVAPAMLDVQFRMHPAIAAFPSEQYYGAALKTGVTGAQRSPPRGFPWPVPGVPIAFVPVRGFEINEGSSQLNQEEAVKVEEIVMGLLTGGQVSVADIGVVSPYAAQVRLLRRRLGGTRMGAGPARIQGLNPNAGLGVEVGSVDGFQGREKEVIVVSAVRANMHGNVGFLSDARRLNVTLTRARRGLVVIGSPETLSHDTTAWGPWLSWAESCGLHCGRMAIKPQAREQLMRLGSLAPAESGPSTAFTGSWAEAGKRAWPDSEAAFQQQKMPKLFRF